eukprot:TRINITY_DN3802_c0_g1_i1.p1 TRINITY_DN3802_c0_g1~~TRINITY_DN3802_c0_g1_i1.p1  ORF type:complete len:306 (-),score=58.50 TRINITY_DN3802_c0_g1_i1:159-1076(-)
MTSESHVRLLIIGNTYFVLVFATVVAVSYFIPFEIRSLGCRQLFKNRMVFLTLAAAISHALDMLLYTLEFFPMYGLEDRIFGRFAQYSVIFAGISLFAQLVKFEVHVGLLYLRSKAVFEVHFRYIKTVKFLFCIFLLTMTVSVVLGWVALVSDSQAIDIAFEVLSIISPALLTIVDFLSTFAFVGYVRNLYSDLQKDKFLAAQKTHLAKTEIIAKQGVVICFMSCVSVLFYWGFWIVISYVNDEDGVWTEFMLLMNQLFWTFVMVLWISLKINLDKDKKTTEDSQTQVSVVVDPKKSTQVDLTLG